MIERKGTHTIELILVENDVKSFQKPMEAEMEKPIKHLEGELIKIRTGRAHTSLIENIPVAVYGQAAMPLKGLAVLGAPEVRLLTVQPWDANTIGDIEKAILTSDLGVTPINDGKLIRIQLPQLSGTRREELLKILGQKVEECKVTIRNIRKDFKNVLSDAKKNKKISENFFNRLSDVLQEITDKYCKMADQMEAKKKNEVTSI